MSGIVSRWPVLITGDVAASDRDAAGRLTAAAIERLFAEARDAYFERCTTIDPAVLELRDHAAQPGAAAVGDAVTVSVSVVEIFSDRFTMNARLRPDDRDGIAGTAQCVLSPGGQVSTPMRDEFIALAHAAQHIH